MSIKKSLTRQGYHIFPDACPAREMDRIISELSGMSSRRTPLNDRNHTAWWDEINIPAESTLASAILDSHTRREIEEEYAPIEEVLFWANRYRIGEHIPLHRDSDGDLQIILAVKMPATERGGGRLKIHAGGSAALVAHVPGQRLLFRATRTPHETTVLVSTPECPDPERVVCIGRIYFGSWKDSGSLKPGLTAKVRCPIL